MNEKQRAIIENVYSNYLYYVQDWVNVAFSAACSSDRIFESIKSLVHEELFKEYNKVITDLGKSSNSLKTQATSLNGRILRVSDLSIEKDKREPLNKVLTNTIWKNVDSVIERLNDVK